MKLREIESGGLISYLIYKDDLEVKNPAGRILIRRFESYDGDQFLVPEKYIYGFQIPEFYEAVSQWIDSNQSSIKGKYYGRRGMLHSDTLKNFIAGDGFLEDLENKLYDDRYDPYDIVVGFKNVIMGKSKEALSILQRAKQQNDDWDAKVASRMTLADLSTNRSDDYQLIKRRYLSDQEDCNLARQLYRYHQDKTSPVFSYHSKDCYFLKTIFKERFYDLYLCGLDHFVARYGKEEMDYMILPLSDEVAKDDIFNEAYKETRALIT